jgi:hypothetical protein
VPILSGSFVEMEISSPIAVSHKLHFGPIADTHDRHSAPIADACCFDVRKLTLRNYKPAEAGLCVGRAEMI